MGLGYALREKFPAGEGRSDCPVRHPGTLPFHGYAGNGSDPDREEQFIPCIRRQGRWGDRRCPHRSGSGSAYHRRDGKVRLTLPLARQAFRLAPGEDAELLSIRWFEVSMKHVLGYQCTLCRKEYPCHADLDLYTCPACGSKGILDVVYDYKEIKSRVTARSLAENKNYSMWRYVPFMTVREENLDRTLRVGWTPLYTSNRLADRSGPEGAVHQR